MIAGVLPTENATRSHALPADCWVLRRLSYHLRFEIPPQSKPQGLNASSAFKVQRGGRPEYSSINRTLNLHLPKCSLDTKGMPDTTTDMHTTSTDRSAKGMEHRPNIESEIKRQSGFIFTGSCALRSSLRLVELIGPKADAFITNAISSSVSSVLARRNDLGADHIAENMLFHFLAGAFLVSPSDRPQARRRFGNEMRNKPPEPCWKCRDYLLGLGHTPLRMK